MSSELKRRKIDAGPTTHAEAEASRVDESEVILRKTAHENTVDEDSRRDFTCGHRFGNFSNYYNFHSCDERLGELPLDMFEVVVGDGKRDGACRYLLDVGCNEGNLSIGLLQYLRKLMPHVTWYMLGVDLDPTLIDRARSKYADVEHARFECLNVTESSFETFRASYFENNNIKTFDVVCCFSTTMWVHLNHGDAGLQRFLEKLCLSCSSLLIIEPQKWKSYKTAVERCRRRSMAKFCHFSSLMWRGAELDDRIVEHIQNTSPFELCKKSACDGEVVAGDLLYWGRCMLIFRHKAPVEEGGCDTSAERVSGGHGGKGEGV